MNYADAMEAPITVKIGDKEITVKPLSQRDYLPWLDELTQQMRESDRKTLAATSMMKAQERFATARAIENSEIIPADLEPKVFTAKGTLKVAGMALVKAGLSQADADSYLDSREVKENEEFAVRVSGLFSKARITDMYPPSQVAQYIAVVNVLLTKGIIKEDDFKVAINRAQEQPDPNPPAPISGANQ